MGFVPFYDRKKCSVMINAVRKQAGCESFLTKNDGEVLKNDVLADLRFWY